MSFISPVFAPYIKRWHLQADGTTLRTHSSRVLPVKIGETSAVLKVALEDEEKHAGILMCWWNGDGAAKVIAADGDALLLERAYGLGSLRELATSGDDDEATRTICRVIATLHAHSRRRPPPEGLVPLREWFASLPPAAAHYRGTLCECAKLAEVLLRQQTHTVALHGDIHHGNILDFGERGWLAVDPKNICGDRSYDYAILFCNPDVQTALRPGVFQRRLRIVCEMSGIDRDRLLKWIAAYAGLVAAWDLEDDNLVAAQGKIEIARRALAELEF